MPEERAYARAGVDTDRAEQAVADLVGVLRTIDAGRSSRSLVASGHYASVLEVAPSLSIALSTDGVGTKVMVAEALERYDTIGIDCVAMNVNDVICVGAEPLALLDYIAVEQADPDVLRQVGEGLKTGAELAGVEIPGGELAQLPELIRGHPSPRGFDLVGTCFGVVAPERIVTGARIEPGDAVIGLPSSGVHSNGLTLARSALPDLAETPAELGGRSVGEELLEPTTIYVRAVLALLGSGLDVRGLAHITSGGLLNLLRLEAPVGYRIDSPLPIPPVFELIAERGGAGAVELQQVFNMGCGFCCVLPADEADAAIELLAQQHAGAAVIGTATSGTGIVELTRENLRGDASGSFSPDR